LITLYSPAPRIWVVMFGINGKRVSLRLSLHHHKKSGVYLNTQLAYFTNYHLWLTEKNLNHTISDWQVSGHTVVALTSREPQYRAATERELSRNQVNLASSALVPVGQDIMMFTEVKDREISYMQGVMMTSGMNKGEMLQYLLNKTHRDFLAIVFIDVSKKNIENIYEVYESVKNMDMRIFHYTRVEDEREKQFGQVLTQGQADIMVE
jgi:hypothetical protein